MFSEWFPDFSLRMKICLLNPIKNVKSRKGLRYDWVHRSCLKLFFGSLKGQTLNSRHCVPGSFKMVKNRAEKTSVGFHTYLVSSKPQCKDKKIHGRILEKLIF